MRRWKLLRWIVLGVLLGAAPPPGKTLFTPWLPPDRLDAFLDRPDVSDPARAAVRKRYEELEAAYAARAEPVRVALENAEDRRHASMAWREERRGLERRFAADVTELLASFAASAWATEIRALRRERVLPEIAMQVGGRAIPDLVIVATEAAPDDARRAALAPALDAYALELDVLLVDWESKIDGLIREMHEAAGNPVRPAAKPPAGATSRPAATRSAGEPDRDELERLGRRLAAMAERVRAVNDRHVEDLDAALGGPDRPVAAARQRRRHPEVFRADPVELAFAALRARELPAERAAAVEAVFGDFIARRDANRRRIVAAIEAWDTPERQRQREARRREIHAAGGDQWTIRTEHPVIELLHARLELSRETRDRLRGIFDEAEYRRLPLEVRVLLAAP
ncbi:MAG: hypothetical protein GY715_06445 [Planctomycetes bacterium]|nr:hypothetical protein [Planctomycetota bacterium]